MPSLNRTRPDPLSPSLCRVAVMIRLWPSLHCTAIAIVCETSHASYEPAHVPFCHSENRSSPTSSPIAASVRLRAFPRVFASTEAPVAADVNLHAAGKAAEPYQTSPGPVGTCAIYIQGRYSECEFTNRPPIIAPEAVVCGSPIWVGLGSCAGKVGKSALY
jgi:hypothetical protein